MLRATVVCVVTVLSMALTVRADEAPWSLERLACMSWAELDHLYRGLEPGSLPDGFARGKVIYCPCDKHARLKSRSADLMWKGKIFSCGTVVNQWAGAKAIRARVDYGPSWLDGRQSIIMDYAGMSHIWADVRDEMREVRPGLYLGAMMYRRCPEPYHKVFFVLETCPCH